MFLDKHILSIFLGWICEKLSIFESQIEKHFAYKKKHVCGGIRALFDDQFVLARTTLNQYL